MVVVLGRIYPHILQIDVFLALVNRICFFFPLIATWVDVGGYVSSTSDRKFALVPRMKTKNSHKSLNIKYTKKLIFQAFHIPGLEITFNCK